MCLCIWRVMCVEQIGVFQCWVAAVVAGRLTYPDSASMTPTSEEGWKVSPREVFVQTDWKFFRNQIISTQ